MKCLYHHGVKGQKWGVRRYQNYDGTLTEDGKERSRKFRLYSNRVEDDVDVEADSNFYRVYTPYNKSKEDKYIGKRLYVSEELGDYYSDFFFDRHGNTRYKEFTTLSKMTFAGEKSVNEILKELGEKPLKKPRNEGTIGTERDFLMKNRELGERFIKKIMEKGYAGIKDPEDAFSFSTSAKVVFDLKKLKETLDAPI